MVKVYTTDTCFYCKELKKYLKEHDIQYEEYNVTSDVEKRAEMVKKSQGFAVPVIDVNGAIIVGFDKIKLNKVLNLNGGE